MTPRFLVWTKGEPGRELGGRGGTAHKTSSKFGMGEGHQLNGQEEERCIRMPADSLSPQIQQGLKHTAQVFCSLCLFSSPIKEVPVGMQGRC